MTKATVTINNWDKYNKRRDIKNPVWLALNNRLLEDSDIYQLTAEELKAWIYLLCQASQKGKSEFQVYFEHAERSCGVQVSALESAICKLAECGIISSTYAPRTDLYAPRTDLYAPRTDLYAPRTGNSKSSERVRSPHYTTRQDKTEQDKTVQDRTISSASKRNAGPKSGNLWNSYRDAFFARYQVEPVRNARVNKHLCTLIDRVGEEAAKELVRFYLTHNDSYYLKRQHDISLCLQHAESLHTQMQRGQPITGSDIRAFEKQDYYEKQIDRLQMEDL